MRALARPAAIVAVLLSASLARAIAFDPSFGTGGIARVQIFGEGVFGLAVQPDGKYVLVGDMNLYPNRQLVLVRFDTSGALDPTFGTGGVATSPLGAGDGQPSDVVVLPDGKLLVAALVSTAPNVYTTALLRFDDDGAVDTTFGTNGVLPAGAASYRRLAVDPNGKVLAGGNIAATGANNVADFALTRLLPDGTPDGGFGMSGVATADLARFDLVRDIVLQPDGRIVAVGEAQPIQNVDFGVARFLDDGTLDSTFGTGGVATTSLNQYDFAHTAVVQADGKIVVGGISLPSGATNYGFALARLGADGTLDTTYGSGGHTTYSYSGNLDVIDEAVLEPSGAVLVGGYTTGSGFGAGRATLARFRPNGTLDTSFGTGGIFRALAGDPDVYSADFLRIHKLADGRLVGAGVINDTVGNTDFAVTRFIDNTCGNAVLEFGEQCDDGNAASGDCCSATCQLETEGSFCNDDGLRCTLDTCDAGGVCRHTANIRPLCRHTVAAGRSTLLIEDKPGSEKDRIAWKLSKGEQVGIGQFADPLTTTIVTLCGFDYVGSPDGALLFELDAPPGGTCGGSPCWKASSSGFRYRNRAGAADGTYKVKLQAGLASRSRFAMIAKGSHLVLPGLPVTLPLTVQLQIQGGLCVEAGFTSAIRNDSGALVIRGD